MASIACELKLINYVLKDFGIQPSLLISLYCNNKIAKHITKNLVFHEHTKYLEIDCQLVKNQIIEGFLFISHISSKQQITDYS